MGAKIILLDLDKTVLDVNMQITDPKVINEIARLQAGGWTIGINSDRHLSSIMHFQKLLQTKGPIIAEKGNIVYPTPNDLFSFSDPAKQAQFILLYMKFINSLRRDHPKILVTSGDTMSWLRILDLLEEPQPKPVVIVNGERQYSFAFYAKMLDSSGLNGHIELLVELSERAIEFFREILKVEPVVDVNSHEYSSCILHHPDSSKTQGTKILKDLVATDFLAIIGDSDSDIIDQPGVIHTAVANATENLKAHSEFVSQAELATGAIECLQFIEQLGSD